MIVVTGAAGFIGSCLVAKLNEMGRRDLIVVDHYDNQDDPKHANLANKQYVQYYDKAEFLSLIKEDKLPFKVEVMLHMGACSSTLVDDEAYFKSNNIEYSIAMAQWCKRHGVRYIYASSAATYGDGELGYSDDHQMIPQLKPLNLYGESKQKFDLWVLRQKLEDSMVGLKFFNVFGPNEYHKDDMRSVVAKAYDRVAHEGKMVLFKSYHPDYKDGEQMRDFIYVKDVVDVVLFFMNHPTVNGIYNVGTGKANTWNQLAAALFKSVNKPVNIEYIEMPEVLRPRYQYFTQAKMDKLRQAGYLKPFTSLEEAVYDYHLYLKDKKIW